jgi:hypothetical protein
MGGRVKSNAVIPKMRNHMKRIIFLIFLLSTVILSQSKKEFLSIAVVRADGILVPVSRFENDTLLNVSNNYKSWWGYERFVDEWYYYSKDNIESNLLSGDLIFFDPDGECSGQGFITNLPIKNFRQHIYPIDIEGFATNKEIKILRKEKIHPVEIENLDQLVPSKVYLEEDLKSQIRRFQPNQIIPDSITTKLLNIWLIKSSDANYFRYTTSFSFIDSIFIVDVNQNGWIKQNGNKYELYPDEPIIVEYYLGRDEYKSGSFGYPVGLFEYKNKIFFVDEDRYWEGVEYFVSKLDF